MRTERASSVPHSLAAVTSLLACLVLGASALAAGMTHTVKAQQVVGPYRLLLMIGPAEKMSMSSSGKGEMMISARKADCSMKGMGGMAESQDAMGMKACNHHVELHVYQKSNGHVVARARVSISLRDAARHMTINVPIATMMGMGPGGGMADYHYGNNIYAAPGRYRVLVHVNRVSAGFSVRLT